MTHDRVTHTGSVRIELHRAGTCRVLNVANLVVDSGLQWIAQRVGSSALPMSFMAAGAGRGAAALTDTALQGEMKRIALTSTVVNAASTVFTATFDPGQATGSISELGIFDAALGGVMLNRVVFPPESKAADATVKVVWTVTHA